MNSTEKTPEEIFESLYEAATTRTKRNLVIINDICKEQIARGSTDFTIATIGRLSEGKGGVKAQPIRNTNGATYRELISAYAHAHKQKESQHKPRKEDEWVDEIADGRIRALAKIAIADKNSYKSQVDKLKRITTLEIDMRKQTQQPQTNNNVGIDLKPIEIAALSDAISEATLSKLSCYINEKNYVIHQKVTRNHDGTAVGATETTAYQPAYIRAIQKILTVK